MSGFQDVNVAPVRSRRSVLTAAAGGLSALALARIGRARAADGPAFKTVREGYLTAACMGDMPLTSVKDGKPSGTDLDMLGRIADKLGLKLDVQLYGFPAVIEAVHAGRADWFGGNFAWTAQRSKVVLMTDAVFFTGPYVVMRKNEAINGSTNVSDMKGHTVGTCNGCSPVPDLKKVPDTTDVKLYDGVDPCIRDIVAGRLDFGVLDAPIVDYMIQKQPDWQLKQVPLAADASFPVLTHKYPAAWGMNPNNPDLFDAVNQGVRWLWKTGQIASILQQYGIGNPDYQKPPEQDPRLGVDRDADGNPIGTFGHTPKNFGQLFA